jgi:hypothetical protein
MNTDPKNQIPEGTQSQPEQAIPDNIHHARRLYEVSLILRQTKVGSTFIIAPTLDDVRRRVRYVSMQDVENWEIDNWKISEETVNVEAIAPFLQAEEGKSYE